MFKTLRLKIKMGEVAYAIYVNHYGRIIKAKSYGNLKKMRIENVLGNHLSTFMPETLATTIMNYSQANFFTDSSYDYDPTLKCIKTDGFKYITSFTYYNPSTVLVILRNPIEKHEKNK